MFKFILDFFSFKKKKPLLPKTFEDAVYYVKENFVIDESYFTGMDIRNELGLWANESPLRDHMKERFGISHPDDIYLLIKKAILNLSFDINKEIADINEHWKKINGAPITKSPTTINARYIR